VFTISLWEECPLQTPITNRGIQDISLRCHCNQFLVDTCILLLLKLSGLQQYKFKQVQIKDASCGALAHCTNEVEERK
jgi:hypothetical protein